jgi:hypothetical protein
MKAKRGVHQLADAVLKIAKASFCTPLNHPSVGDPSEARPTFFCNV